MRYQENYRIEVRHDGTFTAGAFHAGIRSVRDDSDCLCYVVGREGGRFYLLPVSGREQDYFDTKTYATEESAKRAYIRYRKARR